MALLMFSTLLSIGQQNLPATKNFKTAVTNGTRATKGMPGKNYWQNVATYKINAEIIPNKHQLIGSEKISYTNNSPDNLDEIVLHIFQNMYKKGAQHDDPVNIKDVTNGVKLSNITVNGIKIQDYKVEATQLIIPLGEPLKMNQNIEIAIDWQFTIPMHSDIRMGGKDDTSFFLGHWYPKIAVYDDLKGWDRNVHSNGQEFYYDLDNFEYTIKVPDGFVVWGSGELQNANEVFTKQFHKKYKESQNSDKVMSLISAEDLKNKTKITIANTFKFKADECPDIAFAVSDHFLWDASSLKGISEQPIFVSAVYPESAEDFVEVAELAKKSIHYLSTELPGYPYVYPTMTIFNGTNGTSGMEYPMMVNDPAADNRGRTVDVTIHEITHNYFPFTVLSNETEHAWMDESFASALPHQYQKNNAPELSRIFRAVKMMSDKGETDWNVPSMINSTMLKGRTSYLANYMKPGLALYYLEDMLGKQVFKNALKAYIKTWRGKHASPLDFFNTINRVSQKNLNWYFKSWYFTSDFPDLKLELGNENTITVTKIGKLPVPIKVLVTFKDKTTETIYKSVDIWQSLNKFSFKAKSNKTIIKMVLGAEDIPDTDNSNNIYLIN